MAFAAKLVGVSRARIDPSTLSDLVVYADESGDHGLVTIDAGYPIFALAFIVMTRDEYVGEVTPALQRLKFAYWGHDQVVFHERDIRKKIGPFAMLADPATNADFMVDLTGMIGAAPFRLCVGTIDKLRLKAKYANPWSPYEIALRFCMERLLNCLQRHEQEGRLVHVIFESRGKNEDADLELEFRRITANQANWGYRSPDFSYARFEPVFARKDANAAGLQLADLVARPCGLRALRPTQPNRAFEVLIPKLTGHSGLKMFP
ncbi:DUF3800 domain-containing protein [Methylobacterium oryzae]|uniref:DUF3800 domain-containing protein n=1 Tax=Methylobacterium oryzae TaxID=334852 RepID=UPI001F3F5886|nr:DUF3800 domain-containing protein [Methylobacterium oryzae]UIN35132.1 DUF3800 domain-containing protein [Methylobacterium oryzae]